MQFTDELLSGSYINLATWRKNGQRINTPVWFAPGQNPSQLYVFSAGNAGKVKRIRNNPQVELAKCDVTGKLLGEWHRGEARLLNDNDSIRLAKKALLKKYGWQSRMIDVFSSLSGKINRRQYILLCATDEAS